ncbi:MAG: metallophosphoesterase [Spirochaetales bacterium]|nr:metallophosphoesterase [Leptospiraceae bacterium]MCP5480290.1 metallophosphoesterase [Spirochaetales bacterium]
MVPWFNPWVLVLTAVDLFKSWIVDTQIDTRELQVVSERQHRGGSSSAEGSVRAYKMPASGEFYFDFLADTGDGWDSTYSVASLLARDRLRVRRLRDSTHARFLPRGAFVVIGGDLVYPTADDDEYRSRFVRPFAYAWEWFWRRGTALEGEAGPGYLKPAQEPRIYAIPGNHDWYDCLSAFRARFCNSDNPRLVGLWRTDQSRSYFAISLPEKWMLLAIDTGLDHTLDNEQFNYFTEVVSGLTSAHRIILVAAEPDWVFGGVQNNKVYRLYQMLERRLNEVFETRGEKPPRIWLNLSGDIHNYQHYRRLPLKEIRSRFILLLRRRLFRRWLKSGSVDTRPAERELEHIAENYYERHKIVSGGGGAFLHPNHGDTRRWMRAIPRWSDRLGRESDERIAEVPIADHYELVKRFPEERESFWLSLKSALLFYFNNKLLAANIGLLFAFMGRTIKDMLHDSRVSFASMADFMATLPAFVQTLPVSTVVVSIGLLIGLTLWPNPVRRFREMRLVNLAGFGHGLIQLIIVFGVYGALFDLFYSPWGAEFYATLYCHGCDLPVFSWTGPIHSYFCASEAMMQKATLPAFQRIALPLAQFAIAGALGTFVLGLSFFVYLNVFRDNHNDAFAHASLNTHKNFLRLRIEEGGRLTIFPIGFEKPVTYTHPAREELDPSTWDLSLLDESDRAAIRGLRGEEKDQALVDLIEWDRKESYSPAGERSIAYQRIDPFLIEEPIVIDPDATPPRKARPRKRAPKRKKGAARTTRP